MIKARVFREDGFLQIQLAGHARPDVCAAASAMFQACALGVRDLSRKFPREVSIEIEGLTPLDSKR